MGINTRFIKLSHETRRKNQKITYLNNHRFYENITKTPKNAMQSTEKCKENEGSIYYEVKTNLRKTKTRVLQKHYKEASVSP